MNALPEFSIDCCEQMREALEKQTLITVQDVKPFDADSPIPPTAFLISDGGHGGMQEIGFCPFCGAKITIKHQP
jgi:hypothetical protein